MHVQSPFSPLKHFDRHWLYLYRRRRGWHGVSTKQIIISQIFTVIASIIAGLMLDLTKENLILLVGSLLLLPGIIDLAATMAGVMSTKIHHQIDASKAHPAAVVTNAILFALTVGVLAGILVGVFGGTLGMLLFDASLWHLVQLSTIAMLLIGLLCYPLLAIFTLFVRFLGLNPDNIAGPIETALIDIVAVIVVAVVAGWLA